MNKYIAVPMAFGLVCLMFVLIAGTSIPDGALSSDYDIVMDDRKMEFSINESDGFLVIIVAILAVGVISGITILGSGISEYSQSILFQSFAYLGVWAVLSIPIHEVIGDMPYFFLPIWIGLTALLCIGIFQEVKT
jgi:hypothetical protein